MKNIIMLLWFVFFLNGAMAQVGYFKSLPINDTTTLLKKVFRTIVDNDTIISYGIFIDTTNTLGVFFTKLDSFGHVLAYNTVKDPLYDLKSREPGKLVKAIGGYAMYGSVPKIKPDSSGYYRETYMIKVNRDLELEFLQYYPFPAFSTMLNYSILSDSTGFYLFGMEQLPLVNDRNWYVIRTDTEGNLLWKKSYFLANTRDYGSEMLRLDDNTIVLFGHTEDDLAIGEPGDDFSYPRMLAIDTLGEVKWEWNEPGDEDQIVNALMATPDGGFVYTGAEIHWQPAGNLYQKPMVVKLDANFQEEWRRHIDTIEGHFNDEELTSITMSKDGNYIVSGALWAYIYHGEFSPEGDRIWARYDSTWVGNNYPNDDARAEGTALLSSGSIVSGGWFTKFTDAGWTYWDFIMKLSPDGCMDTLACWPLAVEVPLQGADYQLVAYPNPATDVVHFSLSKDHRPRKGRIIISDIFGRKVDALPYEGEDVPWDVSLLESGLYFYRLAVDGEILAVGKVVKE